MSKIKLLKLYEILCQESDEEHPLTTQYICKRLADCDIVCDRRTLAQDVDDLQQNGYEVYRKKSGHANSYYVRQREFSLPEIKILMDAVQAARFIPEGMTEHLVEKLAGQAGSHHKQLIEENLVCFQAKKHTNQDIYDNVVVLEQAIQTDCQISFYYFDLNERGERVYRKEKKRYLTDPVSLLYNEDNYYLIGYSQKYANNTNYRVDRMEHILLEETTVCEEAGNRRKALRTYREQVFQMYGGRVCEVVLEFDRSLIGVIFDKFGEDTKMLKKNDTTLLATLMVQISPTFWGWIFQFGGKMRILSPNNAIWEYREWVERAWEEVK